MDYIGPKLIHLERSVELSSAHRLHNPDLSPEENDAFYGKCNRIHGHGHNYKVTVVVEAAIDPKTNMTIHLSDLGNLLEEYIKKPLDHFNLDADIEFFKTHMSTAENLTVYIWDTIKPQLAEKYPKARLVKVKVYETGKNATTYYGESAPQ